MGRTSGRAAIGLGAVGALFVGACVRDSAIRPPESIQAATAAIPAPPAPPARWFVDASAAWNLTFRHETGARGDKHLVETMGSGACVLDIENDGDLDLYLVQSGSLDRGRGPGARNVLLRNDGGRFTDLSAGSGADDAGYGMGCVAADVEGDGDADLFVTNWGADTLLLNDGAGQFSPAAGSGVEGSPDGWSTAAAFFDADADGWLDLLVISYVDYNFEKEPRCTYPGTEVRAYCEPGLYDGARARLLRQVAPARFEDVTEKAGLMRSDGKGLGVAILDADEDGDLDAFVANDSTPNFLWLNESARSGQLRRPESGQLRRPEGRQLRVREDGALRGLAFDGDGKPQACMGVALGDVDGDGAVEIFVTNFALETNTLYEASSPGWWEDVTPRSGLGPPSLRLLGFGTAFLDADLDGDLDLVVANGQINPEIAQFDATQSHAQTAQLYRNDGQGRFVQSSAPALEQAAVGRGLVTGDFNGDGLVDLVLTQSGGPARLLLGVGEDGRGAGSLASTTIELRQAGPDRDAVGARVVVKLPGSSRLARIVQRGESYLCGTTAGLHFGLGSARSARADVTWPDGARSTHDVVPGYIVLTRPADLMPPDLMPPPARVEGTR